MKRLLILILTLVLVAQTFSVCAANTLELIINGNKMDSSLFHSGVATPLITVLWMVESLDEASNNPGRRWYRWISRIWTRRKLRWKTVAM